MQEAVIDAATGLVVLREMTPEKEAALLAEFATRDAANVAIALRKQELEDKLVKLANLAGFVDTNELREAIRG